MTDTVQIAPLIAAIGVLVIAGFGIRTLTRWGEATRKREEEWARAGTCEIIDADGQTHTVERTKAEDQINATRTA